jgi:hypothetical protein
VRQGGICDLDEVVDALLADYQADQLARLGSDGRE